MSEFRKWGGISALFEAAAYIFGFGMVLAVLVPAGDDPVDFDPGEAVAFLAENQTAMYVWTFVIFIMEQKMLRTIRQRAEMSPVTPPSSA